MDERNSPRMTRRSLLIAASTLALGPRFALAEDNYPSRPIDVTAYGTPRRSATARSAARVVVLPTFFAVPTTTTIRDAAVARS